MKARELPALTGIRFFAAALVFLVHVSHLGGMAWSFGALNLGNIGVGVFFVLSGFILTYNYAPTFRAGVSVTTGARFIWDRLAKIYPLYLLTLLAAIPLELLGAHRDWSWQALWMQLTLVQCIVPINKLAATDHFNVPGWSISCELFFYVLAPALIWAALSARRLVVGAVSFVAAAVVLAVLGGLAAVQVSAWAARFAPARVPEFLLGAVTAACYLRAARPAAVWIRLSTTAGLILLGVSAWVDTRAPLFLATGCLYAPGASLLIFGLAFGQGGIARFLSHRFVVLLGMSSFAFYLIHDLVLRVLKGAFTLRHIHLSHPAAMVAVPCALFVATQLLSILVFRKVEVPAQRFLRGLVRRPTTPAPTPAAPPGKGAEAAA
jgi:peptidoglycan/LPS O-acetylase OafA/YrhL